MPFRNKVLNVFFSERLIGTRTYNNYYTLIVTVISLKARGIYDSQYRFPYIAP